MVCVASRYAFDLVSPGGVQGPSIAVLLEYVGQTMSLSS